MELKQFILDNLGLIISSSIFFGFLYAVHEENKRCEQFSRELREKEKKLAADEAAIDKEVKQ